jgi:hypothetical protein
MAIEEENYRSGVPSVATGGRTNDVLRQQPPSPQIGTGVAEMASGLSYEADIAPIKQRFFRSTAAGPLGMRGAAALSSKFSKDLDESFARQEQVRGLELANKSRELQFETAKFTLDREREKAIRERDMLLNLEPLQKELNFVIGNPEMDARQKQSTLAQIGVNNAGLFAINPAANAAFNSALKGVTSEESFDTTLGGYVLKGGDPTLIADYLEKAGADPMDDKFKLPPLVYAKGIADTRKNIEGASQRTDAFIKQEKERKDSLKSLFDLTLKANIGETPGGRKDPNSFDSPGSEAAVNNTIDLLGTAEDKSSAANLSAEQRIALAQRLATGWMRNPVLPATKSQQAANLWNL